MVCTSPPYYGLRSYLPDEHPDKPREIGLEQTSEEYITKLVQVFREVRRILRPDGTLWLNTGDPRMPLVDIRYSPRSRWSPQWSKRRLQTIWADRCRHVKALGNVNYRLADAPIQLFDADAGVRWAVEQLRSGYSLILLCACREYGRCH